MWRLFPGPCRQDFLSCLRGAFFLRCVALSGVLDEREHVARACPFSNQSDLRLESRRPQYAAGAME